MAIVRNVILFVVMLSVTAYLIMAFAVFSNKPEGMVCTDIELVVEDSIFSQQISKDRILTLLDGKKLNPIGMDMDSISLSEMESELSRHPLVAAVECYKTLDGKVFIEVRQRVPILRVMSSNGDDYYIDERGGIVPVVAKNSFHLPVVTGHVEKNFSEQELHSFGLFLQKDAFWRAQIEQINVLPGNNIELVPRVGDNIIYLGSINGYERKLARVRKFYAEALNKIGWNKYQRINVELDNQIICTKR